MLGFVGVVGGAFVYSQDLKHPSELEDIVFAEDTDHLRPQTARRCWHASRRVARVGAPSTGPGRAAASWPMPSPRSRTRPSGPTPASTPSASPPPPSTPSPAIARGGSTITQQLVRQKLLPDEVIAESGRLGDRKIKELIQSVRVTDYYRGEEGKQAILTAYLNQNFYGNNSYGVLAAAKSYFGVHNLKNLTLAQAATLAAIPQAPSSLRPGAQRRRERGRRSWRCPPTRPSCSVATWCSSLLADDPTRRVLSGDQYSTPGLPRRHAMSRSSSRDQSQPAWKAPHFVWYVREEMRELLCGEAETCDQLSKGGLRVTTTLDYSVQQKAEKWVEADDARAPPQGPRGARPRSWACPTPSWMADLRDQNVWNAALSAIDYETGEIIAYVGSANYYERKKVNKKMQPQYDVLSDGWRQPGSAFKPFTYATGINNRTLTAATMLMDVTTDFGGYTPTDFNGRERGPLRVRDALQFSLNVPAVKALALVGENKVFNKAQAFGMEFQRDAPTRRAVHGPGHAGGAPARPQPVLRDHGQRRRQRGPHLHPRDHAASTTDNPVDVHVPDAQGQAGHLGAGRLRHDRHPQGQHRPQQSTRSGRTTRRSRPGTASAARPRSRPAPPTTPRTSTPTATSRHRRKAGPSQRRVRALGRRLGRQQQRQPGDDRVRPGVLARCRGAHWDAFLTDVTRTWEVRDFRRPWASPRPASTPGPATCRRSTRRRQVTELFIKGTAPTERPVPHADGGGEGQRRRVVPWRQLRAGGQAPDRGYLVLDDAESHTRSWNDAVKGWIKRARKGVGVGANVARSKRTYTAYFFEPYYQPYGQSWGGPFPPTKSCRKMPEEDPSPEPTVEPTLGAVARSHDCRPSSMPGADRPSPTPTPEPTKKPKPTPEPTKPTPKPTAEPTPNRRRSRHRAESHPASRRQPSRAAEEPAPQLLTADPRA